jgi:purine-binding chemotaxis protein CheW
MERLMDIRHEPGEAREILAFKLGNEEYGIDILRVHEIRGFEPVTAIAGVAGHIRGVINLRGAIVPVVDMRLMLAIGTPSYDAFTVVIILSIANRQIGMVVDSVSDVVLLDAEQIRPAPQMGGPLGVEHIVGIGTIDERMIILVDIAQLVSSNELGLVERLAA